MNNIFDLTNVDDIPEDVKKDISVDVFATRIIALFELAKRELSIDEITVGYYRKYKNIETEPKIKKQIMGKVYNMSRERTPRIKSVEGKKGIYALLNEDEKEMTNSET